MMQVSRLPYQFRSGPVLAFGLALLVYLAAALIMRPVPTGDEPHYLLYAYTLAHTGSVDLREVYADGAAGRFYPGDLAPDGHAFDYQDDGHLISVHGIGLPVLMAPVLYLTNSALAIRLEMIVLSALTASQLFRLLQDSGVAGPRDTWLAFAATALGMPFLVYTNQIYPDVPAALLVVFGTRVVASRQPRTSDLLLAALAAAALPWLHVRYLVLTAGLTIAVLVRFLRLSSPRGAFLAGTLVLGSLLLMAVAFSAWYSNPLPNAPYEGAYLGNAQLAPPTAAGLYFSGLGELLDPESGWLPYAPVQLIGLIGLAVWARRFPRSAIWALVFVGGYLLITSRANGVGESFPARYLIPVVLLVAVPLALALRLDRPTRYAFAGLLVISLAIDAMAVTHYRDLYPRSDTLPTGRTVLPVAASLQNVWPTFQAPDLPTSFRVTPDETPRLTGQLVTTGPGNSPSVVAYATSGQDPPGYLSYGPYDLLQAGQYQASFTLAAAGQRPADPVVVLDARVVPDKELVHTELRLADFPLNRTSATFTIPFTLTEPGTVETRVYYRGHASVWLSGIAVTPVAVAPGAATTYPDWPISLVWVVGLTAAALALLRTRDKGDRISAELALSEKPRRPSSDPAAAREARR